MIEQTDSGKGGRAAAREGSAIKGVNGYMWKHVGHMNWVLSHVTTTLFSTIPKNCFHFNSFYYLVREILRN